MSTTAAMQPSTSKPPNVSESRVEENSHSRTDSPTNLRASNAIAASQTDATRQTNSSRTRSVSESTPKLSVSSTESIGRNQLRRSGTTTARMTRKRAAEDADLSDDHIEDQDQEDIATNYSDSAGGPLPSHICLCQPAPKIPRPRNAFILYRQNRHADILATHPNLPNPEISKIAGQLWAGEPERVKEEWKKLAAEEKARHAEQYPDYRFQPRHRPKRGGSRGSPTFSIDQLRCQKCGGRSIASAGSPSTPATATTPSTSIFRATSNSESTVQTSTAANPRTLPQLSSLRLESPQKSTHSPSSPFSPYSAGMDANKKRRFNPYPETAPSNRPQASYGRSSTGGQPYESYAPHMSPTNLGIRRESLPPPIVPPTTFTRVLDRPRNSVMPIAEPRLPSSAHRASMGPPPPPAHAPLSASRVGSIHTNVHGPPRTSAEGTESLRLPPLQKHLDPNASVDTLIANMNFLGKIRILRKTAPPLQNAVNSPASGIRRGSILAVEGDKGAHLDSVLPVLEEALRRTGEYDIKVMHGPPTPHANHASYKAFVDAVSDWHAKISGIVEFLKGVDSDALTRGCVSTDLPSHSRQRQSDASVLPDGSTHNNAGDDSNMEIDQPSAESNGPTLRPRRDSSISRLSQTSKHTQSSDTTEADSLFYSPKHGDSRETQGPKIPLLIIPQYLLAASDAWAAALSITGEYNVPDHWQWVATVWRGLPGPDFVLYIRSEGEASSPGAPPVSAGYRNEGSISGHRPSDAWGPGSAGKAPVDLKEEIGVMVVKQENGLLGSSAVRRVAFELGEWVRVSAGRAR